MNANGAEARWILPNPGHAPEAAGLARDAGIGTLAARVLCARGICGGAEARRFLSPCLSDLHDPFLLRDMRPAVERLITAIERNEKILLYGDYDVDGTASIVILKKILDLAGARSDFFVPHRLRDGYGMRTEVIEKAAAAGVTLVISVDTGIRAGRVVQHARELRIDVIVTDHHLPESELPPAVAVINPNRADCQYPEKNLCGAGVTFKLIQALILRLGWPVQKIQRMTESLLKLVAVATVADVVPLTGENRVIVKLGLAGFHTVRNHGLRALLKVAGFEEGHCPTATQVGFQIAPRMNAAGRMDTAEDVVRMFLTSDAELATSLAEQLHGLNKTRQQTEADIVDAILAECTATPVTGLQSALIFSREGWHRGVVGIVASRVVDRFCRPAVILSEDEASGYAQGSGRSIAGFHLLEALESMPELFTKFGGHKQAAGLTIAIENIPEFRERFCTYAAARLGPDDFRKTITLDAELNASELNERSTQEVFALAPFGLGNPAPLFLLRDAEVAAAPVVFKEKHLRVAVKHGNGRTINMKAWNAISRAGELLPGTRLDIALCLEEDPYSASRGYPGWSVSLKDFRSAAAANSNLLVKTSAAL